MDSQPLVGRPTKRSGHRGWARDVYKAEHTYVPSIPKIKGNCALTWIPGPEKVIIRLPDLEVDNNQPIRLETASFSSQTPIKNEAYINLATDVSVFLLPHLRSSLSLSILPCLSFFSHPILFLPLSLLKLFDCVDSFERPGPETLKAHSILSRFSKENLVPTATLEAFNNSFFPLLSTLPGQ